MSDNKVLIGDMDRKTCIEILKRLLEVMETFDGISPSPERINALKIAISSLETDEAYQLEYESTTKNDLVVDKAKKDAELVARGDVINMIKELAEYHTGDSFNADRVIVNIKQLPSVTPIRPKGHWIVEKSRGYLMRNGCCSNCKDFYTNDWKEMNYCPNCGADMREVVEE